MNTVVIGALAALTLAPQTDTVIPLEGATRLDVEAMGGSIAVSVWDRPSVRIQAEHTSRTYVEIDRHGSTISVEPEAHRGPANIVDFRISVPRSLSVSLEGLYTDIMVEGVDGSIDAESVHGDVTIRGGRGTVRAESVQGRILVENAQGTVDVESAAAEIRIRNSSGEIYAESAGGDIILEGVTATAVDAGSVGGRVYYSGSFQSGGTYFFGSHGGSVTLVIPEGTNARLHLSTLHGTVVNSLGGEAERFEGGQRHTLDVGSGGALVEVETFGGRILLTRPGAAGSRPPETRDSSRPWGWSEAAAERLSETISDSVDRAMRARGGAG